MKKTLTNLSALSTLAYLSVTNVFAQPSEAAGDKIGTISVVRTNDAGVESISRLISAAFGVALLLAVIFVFAQLIMGGYSWISAGGDKAKVEEARTRITNALIGLAIVAAAWALIIVIGKFFGVDITRLSLPAATGTNQGEISGSGL